MVQVQQLGALLEQDTLRETRRAAGVHQDDGVGLVRLGRRGRGAAREEIFVAGVVRHVALADENHMLDSGFFADCVDRLREERVDEDGAGARVAKDERQLGRAEPQVQRVDDARAQEARVVQLEVLVAIAGDHRKAIGAAETELGPEGGGKAQHPLDVPTERAVVARVVVADPIGRAIRGLEQQPPVHKLLHDVEHPVPEAGRPEHKVTTQPDHGVVVVTSGPRHTARGTATVRESIRSNDSEERLMIPIGSRERGAGVRHMTLHGREVAYRLVGQGPLVVLIHGLAGSSQTWEPVIGGLAEHCTVLAPDLPGHGESAKPFDGDYSLGSLASSVRDVIVALGYERATVVGQSLGGGVAMQFAYQFPTRCERLVLVGSGGLGREVTPLLRVLAVPGFEHLFPVVLNGPVRGVGRGILAGIARLGFHPSAYLAEILRSFESLTDPETRDAFVRTMRAVIDVGGQRVSAHDRLPLARDIPTLIVWGSNDSIIPCSHAAAAHETLPTSRIEIFEGVGHYPHCEDPERFLEVLLDFIATTKPSQVTDETFAHALGKAGSG